MEQRFKPIQTYGNLCDVQQMPHGGGIGAVPYMPRREQQEHINTRREPGSIRLHNGTIPETLTREMQPCSPATPAGTSTKETLTREMQPPSTCLFSRIQVETHETLTREMQPRPSPAASTLYGYETLTREMQLIEPHEDTLYSFAARRNTHKRNATFFNRKTIARSPGSGV